jgi:hypothetical protein
MRRRQFITAITLSVLAAGPVLADEPRRLVMASLWSAITRVSSPAGWR